MLCRFLSLLFFLFWTFYIYSFTVYECVLTCECVYGRGYMLAMVCMWKSEENFQGVGSLLLCRFWLSRSAMGIFTGWVVLLALVSLQWTRNPYTLLWICQTIASLPNHRLWSWSLAQRKPCGLYPCTCSHLRYAATHTSLASNNSWHLKSESILPLSFRIFVERANGLQHSGGTGCASLHSSCSFCLVYQLFVFS